MLGINLFENWCQSFFAALADMFNTSNAEIFSYEPWRPTRLFQFEIIINVLVCSFCFISNAYVTVYGPYQLVIVFSAGIKFRRQYLMANVGPRAERVNPTIFNLPDIQLDITHLF